MEKEIPMQHDHHNDLTVPEAAVRHADGNDAEREHDYRAPQLFVIGAAVELLQGGNCGAYSDWDLGSRCRTTE
jgi:hypothetical protein